MTTTEKHPGWEWRDCYCAGGEVHSCCNQSGMEECATCKGWGHYYVHLKSGVMAVYPGGPLLGRLPKEERGQ